MEYYKILEFYIHICNEYQHFYIKKKLKEIKIISGKIRSEIFFMQDQITFRCVFRWESNCGCKKAKTSGGMIFGKMTDSCKQSAKVL